MLSIFEYDEEAHHKLLYEEGVEDGMERGIEHGRKLGLEQGENRLVELLQSLMAAGRNEDVGRAIADPEYRKQLYLENM